MAARETLNPKKREMFAAKRHKRLLMRLPNASNEPCQETTGFLFRHACANPVTSKCDECQKLTCDLHTVLEGMSTYCTGCAKRLAKSTANTANPRRFSNDDPYDPFWYSDSYYHGYGYYGPGYWGNSYIAEADPHPRRDPNDFTEADTSAVQAEGDGNFENEIGGS